MKKKTMKVVYWKNTYNKRECEVVQVNDNNFKLYVNYIEDDEVKLRKLKGSFILRDESMLFQFSGKCFRMGSGSKNYSPSIKLIDRRANTWIAVNADRKKPRTTIIADYVSFAIPLVIKMKLYDILEGN